MFCSSVSIREAFVPFPALKCVTKPPLLSYILFLDKTEILEPCNKLSINLHLIHSAEIYGILPKQKLSLFPVQILLPNCFLSCCCCSQTCWDCL